MFSDTANYSTLKSLKRSRRTIDFSNVCVGSLYKMLCYSNVSACSRYALIGDFCILLIVIFRTIINTFSITVLSVCALFCIAVAVIAPKPTYNVLVRGGGQRLGVKM